jgi:mono/diheme cytochrome c family protein
MTRPLRWVAPVIFTLMILSGQVAAESAQQAVGAELFGEYCAGCHGVDKSGLADYRGELYAFTERMEGVTENMPDFAGMFEADEIAALHAYLTATNGTNGEGE